ncbi:hypothetical protein AWV80_03655 [Cupriavidus sp. UYMU48A]|nr:hypothetical protein AWV80_03655 [Cupriavidus sp. UYMU48A]
MLRAMAVLGGACLLSRAHAGTNIDGVREIPWSALLPEGWDPKAPFRGLRLESLDDADPRAQEALMNAREYWKDAPVEPSLNGAKVRLHGYVVPMSGEATTVREFLLIPYFGACIHVPPPPANQVVHVRMEKPLTSRLRRMNAVWVSGIMRVERFTSVMGDAGYAMRGMAVEPYVRSDAK